MKLFRTKSSSLQCKGYLSLERTMHASLFLTKAYENVFFVTYLLFSQSELLGLCGWGVGGWGAGQRGSRNGFS